MKVLTRFKFKSLIAAVVTFLPAAQAFAQDVCFYHDGIPVYCDEPFRNRIELDFAEMSKYGAPQSYIPAGTTPQFLACSAGGFFAPNCSVDQTWFNGPALPLTVDSDVTVKIHYNVTFTCTSAPNSLCSQGWVPSDLARFELFADDRPLQEPFIVRGSDLVLQSEADGMRWYVLNKPISDRPSNGFNQFQTYLNGSANAGSRISLRVTPLSTVSAVQLAHVTITTVNK
ncbi:MAG TPA: hypothetical protein VE954_31470 [Oligoflexus sp.]|uniref:hypothetical protein n=1 Tax=Oligoflexus sp. TaxID=1971216 RepID=UPI002D70EC5F|nr:hypothetical protein [Oligoflexus sp.]HYX37645.1 hypothetical protein [Oligoflexus sp.]